MPPGDNVPERLEDATDKKNYTHGLSEEDISDIGRCVYRYNTTFRPDIVFRVIHRESLQGEMEEFIQNNEGKKKQKTSLIMIINLNNNHWVTFVISYQGLKFQGYYINSLGNQSDSYKIITDIMNKCANNIPIENLSFKQQDDYYNCGILALQNAADIIQMLQEGRSDIGGLTKKLERSRNFEKIRKDFSKKLKRDPDRRNRCIEKITTESSTEKENRLQYPFETLFNPSAPQNQKTTVDYKKKDLELLHDLHEKLKRFIDDNNIQIAENVIKLLGEISSTFSSLDWNNCDAKCIRNIYGKIDYSRGKRKNNYIDFETLSFFESHPDEQIKSDIGNHISSKCNYNTFSEEFKKLKNNIQVIFLKEELNFNDSEGVKDTERKVIENLEILPNTISRYYDQFFINKMSSEELISNLECIDKNDDPLRWSYTLARILTILGEATKYISKDFKEKHGHIPWEDLCKIRDKLVHGHHVQCDDGLFKKIASEGLSNLSCQLKSIRNPEEAEEAEEAAEEAEEAAASTKNLPDGKSDENPFTKLRNSLSKKGDNKSDKSNKTEGILKNILNEFENLEKLIRSSANYKGDRDYAWEHCVGAIGQYYRDLYITSKEDIGEITSTNFTLKESMEKTIEARNKKIMHDPLSDNTDYLINLVEKQTLPLQPDMKALHTVVHNLKTELEPNTIEKIRKLTNIYRNCASAYFRLNMIESAKEYMKKALESTYPKFYIEILGLSESSEMFSETDNFMKILMRDRIILKCDKCYILLSSMRYRQPKICEEINRELDEAEKIINENDFFDISPTIIGIFICRILVASDKDLERYFLVYKNLLKEKDYKTFAEVTCSYVETLLKKGNTLNEALEPMKNIDFEKIECAQMLISIYTLEGKVLIQQDQPEKATEIFKTAYEFIKDNLGTLLNRYGDQYRDVKITVILLYAIALRRSAKCLKPSQSDSNIDAEYESLIKRAKKLEEEAFELDPAGDLGVHWVSRLIIIISSKIVDYDSLKTFSKEMTMANLEDLGLRAQLCNTLAIEYNYIGEYKDSISHASEVVLYHSELAEDEFPQGHIDLNILEDEILYHPVCSKEETVKEVLKELSKSADQHKNKEELEKAAFYYKKSLIIYKYLYEQKSESIELEKEIKTAFSNLLECGDEYSRNFLAHFVSDFSSEIQTFTKSALEKEVY